MHKKRAVKKNPSDEPARQKMGPGHSELGGSQASHFLFLHWAGGVGGVHEGWPQASGGRGAEVLLQRLPHPLWAVGWAYMVSVVLGSLVRSSDGI